MAVPGPIAFAPQQSSELLPKSAMFRNMGRLGLKTAFKASRVREEGELDRRGSQFFAIYSSFEKNFEIVKAPIIMLLLVLIQLVRPPFSAAGLVKLVPSKIKISLQASNRVRAGAISSIPKELMAANRLADRIPVIILPSYAGLFGVFKTVICLVLPLLLSRAGVLPIVPMATPTALELTRVVLLSKFRLPAARVKSVVLPKPVAGSKSNLPRVVPTSVRAFAKATALLVALLFVSKSKLPTLSRSKALPALARAIRMGPSLVLGLSTESAPLPVAEKISVLLLLTARVLGIAPLGVLPMVAMPIA